MTPARVNRGDKWPTASYAIPTRSAPSVDRADRTFRVGKKTPFFQFARFVPRLFGHKPFDKQGRLFRQFFSQRRQQATAQPFPPGQRVAQFVFKRDADGGHKKRERHRFFFALGRDPRRRQPVRGLGRGNRFVKGRRVQPPSGGDVTSPSTAFSSSGVTAAPSIRDFKLRRTALGRACKRNRRIFVAGAGEAADVSGPGFPG
jgi:hypothetical protein